MQLLTVREVAAQLRCSPSHVERLVRSGALTAVRLGTTRGLRFRQEDVDACVTAHLTAPVATAPEIPSGLPEGWKPVVRIGRSPKQQVS